MPVILCKINAVTVDAAKRMIMQDRLVVRVQGRYKDAVRTPSEYQIGELIRKSALFYNAGSETCSGFCVEPLDWDLIPDADHFFTGYQLAIGGITGFKAASLSETLGFDRGVRNLQRRGLLPFNRTGRTTYANRN